MCRGFPKHVFFEFRVSKRLWFEHGLYGNVECYKRLARGYIVTECRGPIVVRACLAVNVHRVRHHRIHTHTHTKPSRAHVCMYDITRTSLKYPRRFVNAGIIHARIRT